ncbi:hypothetical protein D3C73_1409640 [compost metagenome]
MSDVVPKQVPFSFDHRVLQFVRESGVIVVNTTTLHLIGYTDTGLIHDMSPQRTQERVIDLLFHTAGLFNQVVGGIHYLVWLKDGVQLVQSFWSEGIGRCGMFQHRL